MKGYVSIALHLDPGIVGIDLQEELSATDDTDNEANLKRAVDQAISKCFDRLRAQRAVLAESRLQARQQASVQVVRKGVSTSE